MNIRIGSGIDFHQLVEGRDLWIGGIKIPHTKGALGHSDADVIAHAAADALLGAASLGDIGMHFPDTDPQWAGANSLTLLAHVATIVREAGFEIGNVDCSIVCEKPKIAPHREEMQKLLSDAAGATITIKGRRAEGLGALGREEGIACWAVAVIERTQA